MPQMLIAPTTEQQLHMVDNLSCALIAKSAKREETMLKDRIWRSVSKTSVENKLTPKRK